MDYIKSLFDFTKLPTKILFVFFLITGFIIFSNDKYTKIFAFEKIETYKPLISIVFLISFSILIINFIIYISNLIYQKIRTNKLKKQYLKKINDLDDYEKAILREFYIQGKNSLKMPINDETIAGLLSKKILIYNSQLGNRAMATGFDFSLSINPLIEERSTNKNIDFPENTNSKESLEFLKNNRPDWIHRMNWEERLLNQAFCY